MFKVYGAKVSYYTGKLEAYLRYKEIPYDYESILPEKLKKNAGASQVPALQIDDGRWLTDSTPIIDWLETQYLDSSIVPENETLQFVAYLIEDYADEWLWRPAMHYRWSFDNDRHLLSRKLAKELMTDFSLPEFMKRLMICRRQTKVFVTDDGINAASAKHAEQSYRNILALLTDILAQRPFILGDKPSIADIGLMGPMLRHFAHDPTPTEIMQLEAPAVWEWVTRMWNAKASEFKDGHYINEIDVPLLKLLEEISQTHLDVLASNAAAWAEGRENYDQTVQGCCYPSTKVSRYRVWCAEQLRGRFNGLSETGRQATESVLKASQCWSLLWQGQEILSAYDEAGAVPFAVGLEVVTAGQRNQKPSVAS